MKPRVAILAGGLATRLGTLTQNFPKILLDVAGKSFAVRQIEMLKQNGLTEIVFCLGYLGEQVQEALGDGQKWGVKLCYSFDGPQLLGTGGSIKKALPLLGEEFLVMYGDSYLDCDYRAVIEAFVKSEKLGLMTVFRNGGRWDQSNVLFQNGQILQYDKNSPSLEMEHIDYGLGALRAAAFTSYGEAQLDLSVVYQDLVAREELAAFEVSRRFYEIGSIAGLEELRNYFLDKRPA
jgi:NDP-sugar pyrophosphorylase family protein